MILERFTAIDINFYAAFFLLIVLVIIYTKKDVYSFSSNMFKYIIITNIVLLLFEGFTFFYNDIQSEFAWYMNYSFNAIVFLLTPLVGSFWAMYIDHKIYNSKERLKRRLYYLQPFLIGLVLSIVNLFFPILFSISADNVYSREPLILVNILTMYILLFYIFYLVIKNVRLLESNVISGVLLFMIFPAVGGLVQMMFYGLSTLFSFMALGVVASYIFLETVGTSKDHLTKLFTRIKTDEYIKNLMDRNLEFAMIMIDLDDFKELNDSHGHSVGDEVLKSFGIVLMNVFSRNALVSRFGGDEFLIVLLSNNDEELLDYKQYIFDELKNPIYSKYINGLKFSYGYGFYRDGDTKTIDQLIVEADNKMYDDKAVNKNHKRRKSDR